VLLVDDEEAVLSLEKEILETRSLRVLTASSGKEALTLLAREHVDLVVTDLKMPGEVTGRGLYDWIRKHRPELLHRVVFTMSGAQGNGTVDFLRETGVAYIQKPFEVRNFWSLIQKALRQQDTVSVKS
jgi:DNA-binding NtrC family response regulator